MKYRTSRKRLILFLLVIIFGVNGKSQATFDINDPRNPHCPCHKYQKLADEEYIRLIRSGNKGFGEFAGKTNMREDKIHKTKPEIYRKNKHKKRDKFHRQPRWIYEFKQWDIWKRATNPVNCPVWNG